MPMQVRVRTLRMDEPFRTIHTGRDGRCVSSPDSIGARIVVLEPLAHQRSGDTEEKTLHPDIMVEVNR